MLHLSKYIKMNKKYQYILLAISFTLALVAVNILVSTEALAQRYERMENGSYRVVADPPQGAAPLPQPQPASRTPSAPAVTPTRGVNPVAYANAGHIVATLKTHEPTSIPQPGEEQRFIGSDKPSATIIYKGKPVPVVVNYDTQDQRLCIKTRDEHGRPIQEVTKKYDVWTWQVKGEKNVDEAEALRNKCNREGGRMGGSLSGYEKAEYSTYNESNVPWEWVKEKGIEVKKERVQEKEYILSANIFFSPSREPTSRDYAFLDMPGFSPRLLDFKSPDAYANPSFQQYLSDIRRTIQPNMQNPWLHYTEQEIFGPVLERMARERLYPGQDSQAGFLGPKDNFFEVMRQDRDFLKSAGITHFQIADAVDGILRRMEQPENRNLSKMILTMNEQRLEVKVGYTRGVQLNPFQEFIDWRLWKGYKEGEFTLQQYKERNVPYKQYGDLWLGLKYPARGTGDFTITNLATQRSVSGCDMAPVLMAMGFFEGPGTPYRMDPAKFIDVLGLKKLEK